MEQSKRGSLAYSMAKMCFMPFLWQRLCVVVVAFYSFLNYVAKMLYLPQTHHFTVLGTQAWEEGGNCACENQCNRSISVQNCGDFHLT